MVISVSVIMLMAENADDLNNKTDADSSDNKYLTVWYNDQKYEKYFEELSKEYEKEKGVKINLSYSSDIDYLENISRANKKDNVDSEAPDVYLIDSNQLEAAYGYGLAAENDSSAYNDKNYSQTALNAVTYKGRKVAYPLTFDTEFLIYNTAYFKENPVDFETIAGYAKNFNSAENPDIRHILYWNVNDVFYNYGFVGKYLNLGGNCGDMPVVDIKSKEAIQAFSYYSSLKNVFNIGIDDDFSTIAESFLDGKIICTIATMDEFNKIKDGDNPKQIKYKVCSLPPLNKTLDTCALSCTETLVVNYMSDNEEMAKDFSEYATFKRVDLIYANTGRLAARHTDYMNESYRAIQEQYDNSCLLPKLMTAGDYFVQVQSVLNRAWKGEDITAQLENMHDTYSTRIS